METHQVDNKQASQEVNKNINKYLKGSQHHIESRQSLRMHVCHSHRQGRCSRHRHRRNVTVTDAGVCCLRLVNSSLLASAGSSSRSASACCAAATSFSSLLQELVALVHSVCEASRHEMLLDLSTPLPKKNENQNKKHHSIN